MTYIVTLSPIRGPWPAQPIIRLRRFLKTALRAFGLRCTNVREIETTSKKTDREKAP
jgi:hypothetical protein